MLEINVNDEAEFEALVSDSSRQALQRQGRRLDLNLNEFELTEKDAKRLPKLAGLVEDLTLLEMTAKTEKSKSAFLEAVTRLTGLKRLALISTDPFTLERFLSPVKSHPISKFLIKIS